MYIITTCVQLAFDPTFKNFSGGEVSELPFSLEGKLERKKRKSEALSLFNPIKIPGVAIKNGLRVNAVR